MDKAYYVTEIEQALDRIRAGMSNLNDIDSNFAALAYELAQTAEWVEVHQIKKQESDFSVFDLSGSKLGTH